MRDTGSADLVAIAGREWWVVVLCAAAAMLVAAVAGDRVARTASWEGRGTIAIDAVTVARNAGIPSADQVVTAAEGQRFQARVAHTLQLDPAELSEAMGVHTLDSPPRSLVVTLRGNDATATSAAVASLTAEVLDLADALGASAIGTQKARVQETEAALRDVRRLAEGDDDRLTRLAASAAVWEMRMSLLADREELRLLTDAYSWNGDAVLRRVPAAAGSGATVAAAGLIGLALGLAVAALRERSLRGAVRQATP